jgi:3-oxoisoapionate kinase
VGNKFPHIQAVGMAGMSRTMTPNEMEDSLPGAFSSLKELAAPITHYKVCSTFDSSPIIGSIGRAAEIGMKVFNSTIVPVAVGAPKLKRFVVFGNHFATIGDITYRLDRHPIMSKHPITPMDESDLRLHLGKQTNKKIGLLDLRHLALSDTEIEVFLQKQVANGVEIVILDTLDRSHLMKIGQLLWSLGKNSQTFVVGSSGVEFALTELWRAEGLIEPPQEFPSPGAVDQIVAISGSASPWTASQIKWAMENGFEGIQMNSVHLVDSGTQGTERNRLVDQAVKILSEGKSVVLYSALGSEDPMITSTKKQMSISGLPPGKIGEVLGAQQSLILKNILTRTGLRRAAITGGDTCGHVLKQLKIYVLEFILPLGIAVPLCRASSSDPKLDGLEIALKAGQLGEIDFFGSVRKGMRNYPSGNSSNMEKFRFE